ncbi:MAG: hypothetical protein R2941_20965 [Desulfobacterales bacterium]
MPNAKPADRHSSGIVISAISNQNDCHEFFNHRNHLNQSSDKNPAGAFARIIQSGYRHRQGVCFLPFLKKGQDSVRWSAGLSIRHDLVIWGERSSRKPRLLFRLDGVLLFRLADRQFLALLFQLPPRLTRLEPLRTEPQTF